MLQVVPRESHEGASYARPTAREIEILQLVAKGLTAKEIGQELEISPRTVQKHMDHLCMKLHAKNRTHLVAIAITLGWVEHSVILPEKESPDAKDVS